jgi:hypothetical protein
VCTKEEQLTLAGFLWVKATKVAEIHIQMSVQYGDSGKLEWAKRLKAAEQGPGEKVPRRPKDFTISPQRWKL